MSTTIKSHATASSSVATNHTALFLQGPPAYGGEFSKGLYVREAASTTAPTYHWFEDVQTPGVRSPSTFTAI